MSFFRKLFNKNGEEIPDPKPLAVSPDINPQKSIHDKVLEVLRSERWNQMMREQGMETFDEANDFDMDDDAPDDAPHSPYEADEDGMYHVARRSEVTSRMVEDLEMTDRHRKILDKVQETLNKPKEGKKDEQQVS